MKLRLHNASIRLRLTQPEVAGIGRGESVNTEVQFPGGALLSYRLEISEGVDIAVTFQEGLVRVSVPRKVAQDWATTDAVALDATLPVLSGHLAVLIEKDFSCLHPRDGEDDEATFPNPNTFG